jgi:hypothetical protein
MHKKNFYFVVIMQFCNRLQNAFELTDIELTFAVPNKAGNWNHKI